VFEQQGREECVRSIFVITVRYAFGGEKMLYVRVCVVPVASFKHEVQHLFMIRSPLEESIGNVLV